jgi:hypothetical protein
VALEPIGDKFFCSNKSLEKTDYFISWNNFLLAAELHDRSLILALLFISKQPFSGKVLNIMKKGYFYDHFVCLPSSFRYILDILKAEGPFLYWQ